MKKFYDTVTDRNGNAITGATVTVKNYPSGTTATVYAANAVGTDVNPLTTDADGYFSFWAPDGAYTLTISKTGIATETNGPYTLTDDNSVKNYGAVGDGTTDDQDAIQDAINELNTSGGGIVFFPEGNYLFNTALTLKSNVKLVGAQGAVLTWGGSTTAAITSSTSGVLERAGIIGLKINSDDASRTMQLYSPYQCEFRDLRIASSSLTNICIDVLVNTAGGTNADGNRNAAYNIFDNILQSGTCGTFLRLIGGSSASEVVTLNTFNHISAISCAVRGIDIAKWVDNNRWTGITRMAITANSAVGVEMNSDTPGSDLGVYANNIEHLAIDSFTSLSSRVGLKMGFSDQTVVGYLFNDPPAESGQFTATANAGYILTYAPDGTNDVVTVKSSRSSKLANLGSTVTAADNTNENTQTTINIPANTFGKNGGIRVTCHITVNNTADAKTIRFKLGATTLFTKDLASTTNNRFEIIVQNRGATNSQIATCLYSNDTGSVVIPAIGSPTIDTTAATTFTITAEKATFNDDIDVYHHICEMI